MFDELVRRQIAPLIERLAEMEAEIEDLRRRSENHNRIGIIEEVDPSGTCKVRHGDLLTPGVKWFNPSAGDVSETRVPSVGEQCVLINYGGGDGGAHTVALGGLTSDAFPPASTEAQLHRRTYPDGTESSYDHAAHALNWANGPTSVKATRDGIELMSNGSGFKIDASGVHLVGPAVDHNGTNVGFDHLHKDTQPQQGALSGPPQ